jgi:signal transduction histidine kinase
MPAGEREPSPIPDFVERLFDLPVERWIAWARLALSAIALSAVYFDVSSSSSAAPSRGLLVAYLFYAATLVFATARLRFGPRLKYLVHGIDIAVSSALMYLTDGPTSPFYVFFVFISLAGALRWNWRGAIGSAALLAFVLVLLYLVDVNPTGPPESEAQDLSRAIVRGGFLMVSGALLAYVGGFQERSRLRFAKLAAWPAPRSGDAGLLAQTLAHAASVMRAPRVLVIWEEPDEPSRNVILWSENKLQQSRERPELFGRLVGPAYGASAFIVEPTALGGPVPPAPQVIDPDLRRTFTIESAVTAPFRRDNCSGRVFMLDRRAWSDDDVPLIEIVASRIGVELQDHLLHKKLQATAAERERVKLGRDLHDGLLQGLAAATIHLKIASDQMPPPAQQQLKAVRNLLSGEAHRIRAFIDETRTLPTPGDGVVELAPELYKRIAGLREQWPCEIDVEIDPPAIVTSISVARDIRHILTEAVSNAVRHGRASRIRVTICRLSDRLTVRIQDNGNGFDNLAGSYSTTELAAKNLGPLSLRTRVDDLSGKLFLTSSGEGTDIRIEVPA